MPISQRRRALFRVCVLMRALSYVRRFLIVERVYATISDAHTYKLSRPDNSAHLEVTSPKVEVRFDCRTRLFMPPPAIHIRTHSHDWQFHSQKLGLRSMF